MPHQLKLFPPYQPGKKTAMLTGAVKMKEIVAIILCAEGSPFKK
jgi:hypothetical protein